MLYIDIETDGLPLNYANNWKIYTNYPEIIQISWKYENEEIEDYYVQYSGTKTEFFSKHITLDLLKAEGISTADLITKLTAILDKTRVIIAHNIEFDYNVLFAFLYKNKVNMVPYSKFKIKTFCSMEHGKYITNFPRLKYPKLGELYKKVCNKDFDLTRAHNSKYDIECLIEIMDNSAELNAKLNAHLL
jgi:DNA polymerase III alpha subunit (gram-positive type)